MAMSEPVEPRIRRCRCGRYAHAVCRRCWSRSVGGLRLAMTEARQRWNSYGTKPPVAAGSNG